ncbi:MAG: hypothetical protein OXI81_19040 [Paracoccaceae bacterium]|nr:hypothetical protein [Paracoccaceae bacterium]MDE2913159.1 hypothetical protein [Paracoccaceae bacterium]
MAYETGKRAALDRILFALSGVALSMAGVFTKDAEPHVSTVLLWRRPPAGGMMSVRKASSSAGDARTRSEL